MEYFSAARMRCVHACTVCERSTRARLRGVTFGRIPVIVSRIVEPIRATRTRSRNVTFYPGRIRGKPSLRADSARGRRARSCYRLLSLSLSSSLPDSTSHPANAFAVPLWASRCETASVAYHARGYFDGERRDPKKRESSRYARARRRGMNEICIRLRGYSSGRASGVMITRDGCIRTLQMIWTNPRRMHRASDIGIFCLCSLASRLRIARSCVSPAGNSRPRARERNGGSWLAYPCAQLSFVFRRCDRNERRALEMPVRRDAAANNCSAFRSGATSAFTTASSALWYARRCKATSNRVKKLSV